MVVRLLGGLDEFVDNVRRRPEVGIAHAEVDDVLALAAGLHLDLVHGGEYIRWQTIKSRKPTAHGSTSESLDSATQSAAVKYF